MKFEYKFVSAMEKIFCKEELTAEGPVNPVLCLLHAARGTFAAAQMVLKCDFNIDLEITAQTPPGIDVTFREVGLAPCDLPASKENKDAFANEPGLYPDPLLPINKTIRLSSGNWHAVWISVEIAPDCALENYSIPVSLKMVQDPRCVWALPFDIQQSFSLRVHVHKAAVAPQKLICTNWFHCDCLASYYKVPIWSDEFWTIAENYFRNMVRHGRNMLYTPLWTPPLDTAIGHERPVTQLLKVFWKNDQFTFDFSLLKKFLDIARSCGVTHFEMVHMFTQWGAKATPLILVETEQGMEKLFGWHVPAADPLYRKFLNALLPELAAFFKQENLVGKVYFHISDEPQENNLAVYQAASELVARYLPQEEYPVMDALSSIEYYRQKLLDIPVPSVTHFHDFDDQPLRERWCYYAGDLEGYSARAFGIPSGQNRIIGILLYLYRMDGFLHWGHNFWFSSYSLYQDLDPWRDTSARKSFSGGGSFNVYPGADGKPVDALHYEVFSLGLQDLRLLQTLEEKTDRETVTALIHEGLDYKISMNKFPKSVEWFENFYLRVLKRLDQTC